MLHTFVITKGDTVRHANAVRALDDLLYEQDVHVTIAKYEPSCSDWQHNGFWFWCGYVSRVFRDAGQACTKDDVHDMVLGSIFGWRTDPWGNNKPARTLTRPKKPTKQEMTEIIDRFRVWAAELDIQLPEFDPMKRRVA